MKRGRLLLTGLGLLLSAAAVVVLLRSIQTADVLDRLRSVRVGWFLAACCVSIAGYVFRAARWGEILSPRARPSFGRLFSATMVGFLAINTLPARIGELVRVYVLAKTERIPTATVLASVAVERLYDVVWLSVFWALSLLFAPLPAWFRVSGYLTLGLALVVAAGLWTFHARLGSWTDAIDSLLGRLPRPIRAPLRGAAPAFGEGLQIFGSPPVLARTAAWSVPMWALSMAVFLAVAESLAMHIPLWSPLLLAFVVSVGILLPASPGFIGVLEGACVVALALVGVDRSLALAFGLLYHATQVLPLAVLGLFYAARGHHARELLGAPSPPPGPGGENPGDTDARTA